MTAQRLTRELEEILGDIAADPKARFFHATPRQLALAMREMVPAASPRQADLTAAERELLSAHREETAKLLRDACLLALCEDPRGQKMRFLVSGPQGKDAEPPSRGDLERRATRLSRHGEAVPDASRAAALVSSLIDGPRPEPALITDLAVHSMRLAPSFQSRIYLSVECSRSGMRASERRILLRILEGNPSALARAYADVGLGRHSELVGRPEEALGFYRRAALSPIHLRSGCIYWLALAIDSGKTQEARQAAALVDTVLSPADALIKAYRDSVEVSGSIGQWCPHPDAVAVVSKLADDLGPASKEVADVFTSRS